MEDQPGSRPQAWPSYDGAFRRASDRTFERLELVDSEREAASDQLAELVRMGRPERRRALGSTSRFNSYSLAAHALRRSEMEISRDPILAWELVGLARSVIGRIDPRTCGGAEAVADLEAYALAVQGTTLRVRGDLRAAVREFATARVIQRRGGIDSDLMATVDLLESSLRRDLRQLDSALALLNRAADVFVSLGEQDRVAHAVINRANIHSVKGDWAKAASILRSALDWIPDSRFTLAARHNLADVLVKAGRAPEAAQVLSATCLLYDRYADIMTTNRRVWLEGLIAGELGDLQHASDLLELAVESFMARGYGGDAGLAQLDLAATRSRLTRERTRRRSPCERLQHPLHPRVAAAQQEAHPAIAQPIIRQD